MEGNKREEEEVNKETRKGAKIKKKNKKRERRKTLKESRKKIYQILLVLIKIAPGFRNTALFKS